MTETKNGLVPVQPPRSFTDFVKDVDRGRLHEQLGFILSQLTQDVLALKKQGSVTLKITIKPSKIEHNALEIFPVVSFKQPTPDPKPSIFFADKEGALTRDDPNQHQLPLPATVDMSTGEVTEAR